MAGHASFFHRGASVGRAMGTRSHVRAAGRWTIRTSWRRITLSEGLNSVSRTTRLLARALSWPSTRREDPFKQCR
jgi:hypothetical protein